MRSWWRHQMETFSALLAICAGNLPVPGEFPAHRPVTNRETESEKCTFMNFPTQASTYFALNVIYCHQTNDKTANLRATRMQDTYFLSFFFMMTSSNENISALDLMALCAGNSLVTGDFPAQRPVTRGVDVFFNLRLNKRFSKHPWGWCSETPWNSLWHHCNVCEITQKQRMIIKHPITIWVKQHLHRNNSFTNKNLSLYPVHQQDEAAWYAILAKLIITLTS